MNSLLLGAAVCLSICITSTISNGIDGSIVQPQKPKPLKDSGCNVTNSNKRDCGYSGINEEQCQSAGCCWLPINPNPSNYPWCFFSVSTAAPVPPTTWHPTPKPVIQPTSAPTKFNCNLPGCNTFDYNQCSGSQINTSDYFESWRWFTPPRGSPGWQPSYQDYAVLVAYVSVLYADTNRTSATAEIRATHKNNATLTYYFGGVAQSSPQKQFSKSDTKGPVSIVVTGDDGSKIEIDPIDFVWNAASIAERNGDYRGGQKGAIIELFGWPHEDIELECSAVAEYGYLGVKLFPAQEQVLSYQPFQNIMNPWFFMYQPVSYRFQGRLGTRDDLRNLINTCRTLGVRVYADGVMNQMTGGGNDMNPNHRNSDGCVYWGTKNSSLGLYSASEVAGGGGPSPYYTQDFAYTCSPVTGYPPSQEYPANGYGPTDFHCEQPLNSWNDPNDLNAGWLDGLVDINTERDNVQERLAAYLTDLIGIGFSGFRVDAAKHMQPPDLVAIFSKFKRNMGGALPDDFITYLEVLLGGESDMLMCDDDSGYNYGGNFEQQFYAAGFSETDVNKIKIWNSGYPKEPELGYCTISPIRNAVQNDDADQQTPGSTSRDMGNDGCVLIIDCGTIDDHRQFEITLFENPYFDGNSDYPNLDNDNYYPIRLLLSSFYWPTNGAEAIPDGQSDCSLCTIDCDTCLGMPYTQAYDANSTGYDTPVYTRPHRDAQIIDAMRSWMKIDSSKINSIYDIYDPEKVDLNVIRKTLKQLKIKEKKLKKKRASKISM